MRGVLRRCALALLVAGAGGAVVAQTAAPQQQAQQAAPAMTPQQVGRHTWFVQGLSALGSPANQNFISNAGFIVTPAGVVVVDALGSPALAQRLLQEIRRVTPQPVTHVVLTHYHADHVYGLQVFKAAGAKVIAHAAGREYLASDTAQLRLEASRKELAPWVDAQTRIVAADEWIAGPLQLEMGGVTVRIAPAGPAHTPEDLVVHVPADKVLFAGDLVFRNRIPFVGQADSRRWVRALDELLAYGADVIVPGHGPASREARRDMELTRDYLLHLRRVMGEAAKNLEPWEDAYKSADWSRFEQLPLFQQANRMNAYNTYLLMEREKD
jgi:glyoxylase-like metal-dependent hydrolase (beta-lactamase superfamily II)